MEALLAQSLSGTRPNNSEIAGLRCCCGRPQCAFLQSNLGALEGLERDVRTAAQIGQVRKRDSIQDQINDHY